MRIIAGKHKGRRLAAPNTSAVRPTTDRVRESLFAILGDLTDATVIDGYAGSGALGCEALSRGARKVWFFDRSRAAIDRVRQNVETIDEMDRAQIVNDSFARALLSMDEEVDLVFLDPPYGSDQPAIALGALAEHERIGPGCLIVLEQDRRDELPEHPAFELDETRVYGDTRLAFLYRR
jgi:16S rRNA (guanine966-N2)-methyltransferase